MNQSGRTGLDALSRRQRRCQDGSNNNALFETWARDGETFVPNPVWPTTPTPVATGERALGLVLQQAHSGGPLRFAVPGGNATEETRRNKPDFDFIVANNLYKVSGLKAAFAANKPLSFPVGAMEVKANWVEVSGLKAFNGFTARPRTQQSFITSIPPAVSNMRWCPCT